MGLALVSQRQRRARLVMLKDFFQGLKPLESLELDHTCHHMPTFCLAMSQSCSFKHGQPNWPAIAHGLFVEFQERFATPRRGRRSPDNLPWDSTIYGKMPGFCVVLWRSVGQEWQDMASQDVLLNTLDGFGCFAF